MEIQVDRSPCRVGRSASSTEAGGPPDVTREPRPTRLRLPASLPTGGSCHPTTGRWEPDERRAFTSGSASAGGPRSPPALTSPSSLGDCLLWKTIRRAARGRSIRFSQGPRIVELRLHSDHGPGSPNVPTGRVTTSVLRSSASPASTTLEAGMPTHSDRRRQPSFSVSGAGPDLDLCSPTCSASTSSTPSASPRPPSVGRRRPSPPRACRTLESAERWSRRWLPQ